MACPRCGEICSCVPDARPIVQALAARFVADDRDPLVCANNEPGDARAQFHPEGSPAGIENLLGAPRPKFVVADQEGTVCSVEPAFEVQQSHELLATSDLENPDTDGSLIHSSLAAEAEEFSWRDEVSARLSRYRARRRPREPRYPSLRLKFDAPEMRSGPTLPVETFMTAPATHHSLAMEPEAVEAPPVAPVLDPTPKLDPEPALPPPTAKIIEFPRSAYVVPTPVYELADPVVDRPRILEAPEVVPPPPALGGMTIEDAVIPEPERRPGIDMPLQTAPVSKRVFAIAVDALIVLIACVAFGAIFYRMTASRPPLWQLLGLGVGLPSIFWAGYQYLLIVYSGSTPGLWAARLRLANFDGKAANRRKRRLRVLASYLSAVALGMGYAWQFLDEDKLCWHERVTHTYLAPNL
jgi:uncharacterized RDD family membrane protein YckC